MRKKKVKEDRYYQEFILFIEREAKEYINSFRKRRAIDPEGSYKTLKDWEETLARNKNIRNKKYIKLNKKIDILLSKISKNDVKEILKDFEKPISWLIPLRWYILTGKIIPPSSRYEIGINDEQVIMRLSPEANIRDIKDSYELVTKIQEHLVGSDFKKKRMKPKFGQIMKILKAEEKYDDLHDKVDYVFGDDGSIDSLKLDNKRKGVIRKTKQRYKKYI